MYVMDSDVVSIYIYINIYRYRYRYVNVQTSCEGWNICIDGLDMQLIQKWRGSYGKQQGCNICI